MFSLDPTHLAGGVLLMASALATLLAPQLPVRIAAGLVVVLVVGWLFAEERRRQVREAHVARALGAVHAAQGFARSLGAAVHGVSDVFEAHSARLAARNLETRQNVLWRFTEEDGTFLSRPRPVSMTDAEAGTWFFDAPAPSWHAERRGPGRWTAVTLDRTGRLHRRGRAVPGQALERLSEAKGRTAVTVFDLGDGEEWEARLLLFGAHFRRAPGRSLRLGRRLVDELVVIVRARFVLGRVRSRLGAMERARVARELHDGTIQSLVAVQMAANVLRRRAERDRSPYAPELVRIERLLSDEIPALRDTMERLKPLDVTPAQLVGFLDETVARFDRETGVKAHFQCSEEDVDLPPRVCQELARIAQEALRNVRRHSGARNVVVRLLREESQWRLVVDDDGEGFPFTGRLSHAELDAGRRGPHVIKERVRALGGELIIETAPGGGARLDIHVPREVP